MSALALVLMGPAGLAIGPLGEPVPTASPPVSHDAVDGAWGPVFDGEVPAVNLVVLDDDTVLYWSGVEADPHDHGTNATFFTSSPMHGESRLLDLGDDGSFDIVTPGTPFGGPADLFCTGQTFLPDGRVLAAGGTEWQTLPSLTTPLEGTHDARIFDPETRNWTKADDMDFGRWYPSVISLPDGSPLVLSGITNLTHPNTMVDTHETYDAAADLWSPLAGDNLLPMYPRVFVVPGGPLKGQLFYQTTGTLWGPFGEHPAEPLWNLQQAYDPATESWSYLGPSVFGVRQHGASLMLPLDPSDGHTPRILTFGGSLLRSVAATNTVELADLGTSPPTNTVLPSMEHPRWHLNGVLLPDGNVLAVGGGLYDNVYVHGQENVPVLEAELFDTRTRTWQTLDAMEIPRMYHSTSVLLPDGRVLVGGHVPLPNPFQPAREGAAGTEPLNPQVAETRFEIYSPPYLFRDGRPVIDAVDETALDHGDVFQIELEADIDLAHVLLMRPGATTHAFDMTQRAIHLEVLEDDGTTLTVRAPPDATVASPGQYMVFVAADHALGPVPSEAAWVTLGLSGTTDVRSPAP